MSPMCAKSSSPGLSDGAPASLRCTHIQGFSQVSAACLFHAPCLHTRTRLTSCRARYSTCSTHTMRVHSVGQETAACASLCLCFSCMSCAMAPYLALLGRLRLGHGASVAIGLPPRTGASWGGPRFCATHAVVGWRGPPCLPLALRALPLEPHGSVAIGGCGLGVGLPRIPVRLRLWSVLKGAAGAGLRGHEGRSIAVQRLALAPAVLAGGAAIRLLLA